MSRLKKINVYADDDKIIRDLYPGIKIDDAISLLIRGYFGGIRDKVFLIKYPYLGFNDEHIVNRYLSIADFNSIDFLKEIRHYINYENTIHQILCDYIRNNFPSKFECVLPINGELLCKNLKLYKPYTIKSDALFEKSIYNSRTNQISDDTCNLKLQNNIRIHINERMELVQDKKESGVWCILASKKDSPNYYCVQVAKTVDIRDEATKDFVNLHLVHFDSKGELIKITKANWNYLGMKLPDISLYPTYQELVYSIIREKYDSFVFYKIYVSNDSKVDYRSQVELFVGSILKAEYFKNGGNKEKELSRDEVDSIILNTWHNLPKKESIIKSIYSFFNSIGLMESIGKINKEFDFFGVTRKVLVELSEKYNIFLGSKD